MGRLWSASRGRCDGCYAVSDRALPTPHRTRRKYSELLSRMHSVHVVPRGRRRRSQARSQLSGWHGCVSFVSVLTHTRKLGVCMRLRCLMPGDESWRNMLGHGICMNTYRKGCMCTYIAYTTRPKREQREAITLLQEPAVLHLEQDYSPSVVIFLGCLPVVSRPLRHNVRNSVWLEHDPLICHLDPPGTSLSEPSVVARLVS